MKPKTSILHSDRRVHLAQILFFLNALIWLVFMLLFLSDSALERFSTFLVSGLMFGNALAMLLAGLGLGWTNRLAYLFALALLVVNILLTFTDQFGLLDFLTLLLDLVILGLLVAVLKIYFHRGSLKVNP
jgi:hypothetical protein